MDEPLTAPFLMGDQVYLRKLTASDVGGNYVEWMNDEEVTRYLESGYFPASSEDVAAYVEDQSRSDDVVFLSIVERGTDDHVGNIKLGPINWIYRRSKIGLIIGEKEKWGSGYGTAAVELLTEHALRQLNLHKIVAQCYEPNVGSKAVFEKVGYETEARLTRHAYCDGEYVDVFVLSIFQDS